MTTDFGKGQAKRTCAAADRTGHAMLHTMYGQARHSAEFFIEYFAIDLIMDDEGRCRGVVALSMQDGTLHRFRAHQVILATGGYGRAYFSLHFGPYLHRRRQPWCSAPAFPSRTWSSCSSIRPASMARACSSPRRARRRRLLAQFQGREIHGALRAVAKDLASRDVVSRAITIEIREAAATVRQGLYPSPSGASRRR